MIEHARKQNEVGNDVVVVEVGGAGGGKFYQPNYIRVAEIVHDTQFTKINAKNVIDNIAEYEFNNYGGRGENSRYHRRLDAAKRDFEEATASKESGKKSGFAFEKGDNENER